MFIKEQSKLINLRLGEKISKKDEDEKCPICYEFINIIKENGKEIFTPSSCKHQICVECFGRMCRAFPYVQLKYD